MVRCFNKVNQIFPLKFVCKKKLYLLTPSSSSTSAALQIHHCCRRHPHLLYCTSTTVVVIIHICCTAHPPLLLSSSTSAVLHIHHCCCHHPHVLFFSRRLFQNSVQRCGWLTWTTRGDALDEADGSYLQHTSNLQVFSFHFLDILQGGNHAHRRFHQKSNIPRNYIKHRTVSTLCSRTLCDILQCLLLQFYTKLHVVLKHNVENNTRSLSE